tara:strand:- start:900 stop:1139 length:240 start_codon:yes stop_codon:yes gene_type:complete
MAKLTPRILDEITASFHRVGGEVYLDELALRHPPTLCLFLGRVLQAVIKAGILKTANSINLNEAMEVASARLARLVVEE